MVWNFFSQFEVRLSERQCVTKIDKMKMYRIYSIFVGLILIGLSVVHGFVVNDIESKNLTIYTLNEAVNRLTLDNSAIYRAFVTSDDRVRNIILKQTIQPERRNFFGLIIIPCKTAASRQLKPFATVF